MAAEVIHNTSTTAVANEVDSDYGSDLDDTAINHLFSQALESQPLHHLVLESLDEPAFSTHANGSSIEQRRPMARLARVRDNLLHAIVGIGDAPLSLSQRSTNAPDGPAIEVEYDQSSQQSVSASTRAEEPSRLDPSLSPEPENDTRTPLQRFRTRPKKPLSVTDIVSPAWCELQYWYSLTKYGRIRATPAMKQGTGVHRVLEEQVHTSVPVEVVTKEDRFALRLWNVVQGLRTLRRTGLTRELEVWGVLEGEVVNGIIDEISTKCPDEQAEADIQAEMDKAAETTGEAPGRKRNPAVLPPNQRTLTDFLTTSSSGASILENNDKRPWLSTLQSLAPPTLYLTDVKTRQSRTLPSTNGGQLRPVHMQLMLYHRLFSALATNKVDSSAIFSRYGVDPEAQLSDTFLAQMSSLDFNSSSAEVEVFADRADEPLSPPPDPQDSLHEILAHNTLSLLWQLMNQTFALLSTFPLSPMLTVTYHSASTGTTLGHRHFPFSAAELDAYVASEMDWWQGRRAVRGVEVEEAYKCRICEFAPGCEWRIERVEERSRRARENREAKSNSDGKGEGRE